MERTTNSVSYTEIKKLEIMIKKDEIFEELDWLKFGEMLLLNPNDKLRQPYFFIKEKDVRIKEIINKNYFDFEIRFFILGRVTAYLFLFIFDENYDNIYGQWINIYNKTDKKNSLEMNFQENIYIAFIDEKVIFIENGFDLEKRIPWSIRFLKI